jgi:hypothetical protein
LASRIAFHDGVVGQKLLAKSSLALAVRLVAGSTAVHTEAGP